MRTWLMTAIGQLQPVANDCFMEGSLTTLSSALCHLLPVEV